MDINRIRWAIRRGMLELDLVLQPFVENIYSQLDERKQYLFANLLESEDQDLYLWLMNKADPIDKDLLEIVEVVRANTGIRDKY